MERPKDNIPTPVYPEEKLRQIVNSIAQTELKLQEAPLSTKFDYGTNTSALAKEKGVSPLEFSKNLASKFINIPYIKSAEAVGPFLNFEINMGKFGTDVLNKIAEQKDDYGKEKRPNGRKVIIDMSSPNIAKRMSYGHLRSTIIGDAVANLYRARGFEVVRDNHLGDWGTQFGKLIVAVKKWGNERELTVSDDPIGLLQDLYVKFHSEESAEKEKLRILAKGKIKKSGFEAVEGLASAVKKVGSEIMTRKQIPAKELDMEKVTEDALDRVIESTLEKEGRNWFLRLEQGDPEARRIWQLCVKLSLKEFNQIYKVLGVSFEETLGESFYEDKLQPTMKIVERNPAASISEGALVMDMGDVGLGVAIVRKSDGASLYFTRDLACAIYRQEEKKADSVVYVVGEDQKQYFQQLFEALKRLGYKIGENASHVYFGMVSLPEGKMSTRKGRVILLKDVIAEGVKRAETILDEKNPALSKNKAMRQQIIRQIAIGALKWNDLSQDAKRPIVFDWDKALNFEGNSAPYIQYTAVRAKSILSLAESHGINTKGYLRESPEMFQEQSEKALIRTLAAFPEALKVAFEENNPSRIAAYVYELSKRFNSFYTKNTVLKAEDPTVRLSRLKLVEGTIQVITNALSVLGIEVPEKM